jgi:hypothetical protein
MCVALHWSLFPLLSFFLFTATLVLLSALTLILYIVLKERNEGVVSREHSSLPTTFWSSPLTWTANMLSRPPVFAYSLIKRQFNSAASVIRWKNGTQSTFDHDSILHNSRWQSFWRERVLPANNEFLRSDIPLDAFPVVRQTQLGLIVAYSLDYVKDIFQQKQVQPSVSKPERYVLILRSPKTNTADEIEPSFKEVVTDMLQFKQVSLFIQLLMFLRFWKMFNL